MALPAVESRRSCHNTCSVLILVPSSSSPSHAGEIVTRCEQPLLCDSPFLRAYGALLPTPPLGLAIFPCSIRSSANPLTCSLLLASLVARRLAAISLAARVSSELSSQLGGTVGYAVRGDTKQSATTQVLFMTYGVLLRMLTSSSSPLPCTHLLLDEVHERSSDLDLVLLSLKNSSSSSPSFKTVLMSATVDASMFTGYLPSLNCVNVPGRTFPVERFYLEHAIGKSVHLLAARS